MFVSLQRERRNRVEPRCAVIDVVACKARTVAWLQVKPVEMMSNSTFLRPYGSKRTSSSGRLVSFTRIQSWSRVASFYIFRYLGRVNLAGSFILVAVMKFTWATSYDLWIMRTKEAIVPLCNPLENHFLQFLHKIFV